MTSSPWIRRERCAAVATAGLLAASGLPALATAAAASPAHRLGLFAAGQRSHAGAITPFTVTG